MSRATLAQLVERLIRNQQVAGSIPAGGSTFSYVYLSPSIPPVQNPIKSIRAPADQLRLQCDGGSSYAGRNRFLIMPQGDGRIRVAKLSLRIPGILCFRAEKRGASPTQDLEIHIG